MTTKTKIMAAAEELFAPPGGVAEAILSQTTDSVNPLKISVLRVALNSEISPGRP